jgi:hypothetical protein
MTHADALRIIVGWRAFSLRPTWPALNAYIAEYHFTVMDPMTKVAHSSGKSSKNRGVTLKQARAAAKAVRAERSGGWVTSRDADDLRSKYLGQFAPAAPGRSHSVKKRARKK